MSVLRRILRLLLRTAPSARPLPPAVTPKAKVPIALCDTGTPFHGESVLATGPTLLPFVGTPQKEWPKQHRVFTVRKPTRVTLVDGRTADVMVVASFDSETRKPLSIVYEPITWGGAEGANIS